MMAAIFMLSASAELLMFFIYNICICCADGKSEGDEDDKGIEMQNKNQEDMGGD